jgi:hypothetical protein
MEMEEARGFYTPPEKNVCSNCFGDYAIKEFIQEESTSGFCDYCGKRKRTLIAAPLESVIEFIMEGIRSEWGDPNDEGVGWMSSEGGWIGADVIDSYDLLSEEIDLQIENEILFSDILDTIFDRQWCRKNPYALSRHQEWLYDWESFSNQVKHQARYMFFKIPKRKPIFKFDKEPAPYEILFTLRKMVNRFGLIKAIEPGTLFIRARSHKKGDQYTTLKDLGPPPKEKTLSNRMSPAGIVMLYGALDKNTAIREIRDVDQSKTHITTVAFKVLEPFKVLDLTGLPPVPSLFDSATRDNRSSVIFLRSFCYDISKPIEKDDRVHIEYVPTQVVTEYFRLIFRDEKRKPIKGIIYPSSRLPGGKSCVLFFTSENCTADGVLEKGTKFWLSMESSTIRTRKLR